VYFSMQPSEYDRLPVDRFLRLAAWVDRHNTTR